MKIDTSFNFQAAMGDNNRDADKYSSDLQKYHQILWSKPLPNGEIFRLERLSNDCLLRYASADSNILLSSDRAVATFSKWKRLQHTVAQVPQSELDDFINITETIGGRDRAPREWYCVPIQAVRHAVELIDSGEIVNYTYNSEIQEMVEASQR
ncbi:hypothetical protein KC952_00080 [Candidatus Saccharibacteria bacterium]|nr:hypothetical protein [Candidatus Saccharibacteria bacterium]